MNFHLWTPLYRRARAVRLARNYLHQVCTGTVCNLENQPVAMDNKHEWQERVNEIHVIATSG